MAGPEAVARVAFTGAGVALAIVALLHGSGAFAQSSVATQETTIRPVTASASSYDSATLTAFVQAARTVSALRDKYMPRIAAANIAERSERASALFDEMRARMHDATDAAGLGVATYEAISAHAARDEALRGQIEVIMSGGSSQTPTAQDVQAPAGNTAPAVARSGDPQSGDPITTARRAMDSAAARREIETLQRRLTEAEGRVRKERQHAARELKRMQASHAEETEALTAELASRPSLEDTMTTNRVLTDVSISLARTEGERVALRREITHLSRSLESAVSALASLGDDLAQHTGTGVAQPFTRLAPEPVLFAGSASGLSRGLVNAQPNIVLQARLEAAQTRSVTLQTAHATQRGALQREIVRITADLRVTMASLAALEAGLNTPDNSEQAADHAGFEDEWLMSPPDPEPAVLLDHAG